MSVVASALRMSVADAEALQEQALSKMRAYMLCPEPEIPVSNIATMVCRRIEEWTAAGEGRRLPSSKQVPPTRYGLKQHARNAVSADPRFKELKYLPDGVPHHRDRSKLDTLVSEIAKKVADMAGIRMFM